jgi:O-antigen/teichoic acid export membrane protein
MTNTPSAGRTVARNTIFLFAAQITVRVLGFVPVILLANYLGVGGYGLYNFALAFSMLFLPVCDLGIDTLIVREIAAHPETREQTGRNALGTKLILAFVAFALIAVAAFLEGSHRDRFDILLLAGAITILRAFPTTLNAFFRAAQKMEIEAILVVSQRSLEIVAALVTVIAGFDLFVLMVLMTCSGLLGTALAFYVARRNGFPATPAFSVTGISTLLRGGLPFALTGISVTLYIQIGTVILGYIRGESAVGIYRSAYNLIFALSGFSAAIAIALFPAVAQQYRDNRTEAVRLSARSLSTSLMLGLPVATGCTALAAPIIAFLYRADFAQAATALRILSWWIPVMYATSVLGHILAAINKQNLLLAISVANALINVALNFALIPLMGHDGAAIATVATELIGLLMLSIAVKRWFGWVYDVAAFVRVAGAAGLILPLWFLSGAVGAVPLVLAGAAIYVVTLLWFGAITIDDVKRVFRMMLKRPTTEGAGQ